MFGVTTRVFAAGSALLLAGGSAFGQLQFNFTYQQLSGVYNSTTSVFSATAVNIPSQISSNGIVSRNAAPGGNANFLSGFTSQAGSSAGFVLTMNVTNNNGSSAAGAGTFTGTDVFGDTFSGTIAGDPSVTPGAGWTQVANFLSFTGTLTNVVFTPAAPGNTQFTGSDGSSFNFTTFPGAQPFNGAIITLSVVNGGGFFNGDFGYNGTPGSAVPTQVNGQLVPGPASVALLGLGGLVAGRRRRGTQTV